jgi:hypothetical protein
MSVIDRHWLIKDGNLSDKAISHIRSQKGQFELVFRKYKSIRTDRQNAALHVYFQKLSDALNKDGFDMRAVISDKVDLMWTPYSVKEYLWKATQRMLFGKKSTTQLRKTGEIDQIYDVINKTVGERTGIYVPFPSEESLYEDYATNPIKPQKNN